MAMKMDTDLISYYSEEIKPSSPTPPHLTNYSLSLLDQFAPPFYIPVLLFYSASGTRNDDVSEKLKISLSKSLSDFYPFAGRFKGNSSIDCNDKGALFIHSKAHGAVLSKFLENPDASLLQQFLPFPPYTMTTSSEEQFLLAVKVTAFDCGGIGVGVCVSHKVADGSTVAMFLNSWSRIANGGNSETPPPCFDGSTVFQPKDCDFPLPSGLISTEKLLTKRFRFGGEELSRLRTEFRDMNPTKVEAVTALIWKTALEAAKTCSEKNTFPPSAVSHIVNIRARAEPPLLDLTVGNLWQSTVATLMDLPPKGDIELRDLAGRVRKSIKRIDSDHVSQLRGEGGFGNAWRFLMEAREMALRGGVERYSFSSWTRFPFYEVDLLGWGKPTWVSTTSVPMKNVVILMGTRSGDGIEAWITLTQDQMGVFQANPKLLQFVSTTTS